MRARRASTEIATASVAASFRLAGAAQRCDAKSHERILLELLSSYQCSGSCFSISLVDIPRRLTFPKLPGVSQQREAIMQRLEAKLQGLLLERELG